MIREKEMRDSAKGEDCTARIPGCCNYNPETTVLAHYGEAGEKGMGIKPDDTSAAYLCNACHDMLDGRTKWSAPEGKMYYWFRAMRRTWRMYLLNEVLIPK